MWLISTFFLFNFLEYITSLPNFSTCSFKNRPPNGKPNHFYGLNIFIITQRGYLESLSTFGICFWARMNAMPLSSCCTDLTEAWRRFTGWTIFYTIPAEIGNNTMITLKHHWFLWWASQAIKTYLNKWATMALIRSPEKIVVIKASGRWWAKFMNIVQKLTATVLTCFFFSFFCHSDPILTPDSNSA